MSGLADRIGRQRPFDLRRAMRDMRVQLRRSTHRLHSLPDFLLIGGQRCGTTSLHTYLSSHPAIVPPVRKETQFFSNKFDRGEAWYRAHFLSELRKAQLGYGDHKILTFEATPYYLFHPHAANRAAQVVPHSRIIVLLRNPIDRAFSHYQHSVRLGLESLSFEEAIAAEPERLAPEVSRILADPGYESITHQVFSYVARGIYVDQLLRWMEHFPPDRFLIIHSEDLYANPSQQYQEVQAFLGLPTWEPPEFRVHGRGSKVSASVIPPGVRNRLGEHFAPYNERLQSLLGREMGWQI